MKLLQKKKLGLVPALSCVLTLSHAASASVMINVSDDGTDLTYHITGTIDRTGVGTSAGSFGSDAGDYVELNMGGFYSADDYYLESGAGFTTGNDPYVLSTYSNAFSNGIGGGFGYLDTRFVWDSSLGADPDTVVVDRTFVQRFETVASAFGTNLDSGPVELWTHTSSGDTISIQAFVAPVPEPSSSLLLVAGVAGLAFRRNRN
jgi:hypothetical protein